MMIIVVILAKSVLTQHSRDDDSKKNQLRHTTFCHALGVSRQVPATGRDYALSHTQRLTRRPSRAHTCGSRARLPGDSLHNPSPVPTSPPSQPDSISPPPATHTHPLSATLSFQCTLLMFDNTVRDDAPSLLREASGAEVTCRAPARRLSHAGDPARQAAAIADPLAAALVL